MSTIDTSSDARIALAKRVVNEGLDFEDIYDGFTGDFYDAVTNGVSGADSQMIGWYLAEMIDPKCHAVSMDSNGTAPWYKGIIHLNDSVPGCSECGYPFGTSRYRTGANGMIPRYCPNCGRRVIASEHDDVS